MNTLHIIQEIQLLGLEAVIAKYKLIYKDYGHKFLLKYDQIESSPFRSEESVKECRGLILSKDFKVMSYLFKRFFNFGEGFADVLDWSKTRVFKKEDGSLIGVYWDWVIEKWCIQTSGTAEGKTSVGDTEFMFNELFLKTAPLDFYNKLKTGFSYIFELCTPYNIVVTPHKTSYIKLLGCRNLETLKEVSFDELKDISETIQVGLVDSYDCSSMEDLIAMAKELPQVEEGYIAACYMEDGTILRNKVKNPAYVALHHLKSKICKEELFTVIFKGEQDEFLTLFPEYTEGLNKRLTFVEKLSIEISKFSEKVEKLLKTEISRKDFALFIQSDECSKSVKPFSGSYYRKFEKTEKSIKPFDILSEQDVKKLNKMFEAE